MDASQGENSGAQIYQNHHKGHNNEVNREEIQVAINKAVELRALHAALVQGNNPAATNLSFFPSPSPVSLSAHDYPVFTPSYEDETLPGQLRFPTKSRTLSQNWDEYNLGGMEDQAALSDYQKDNISSRKGLSFPSGFSTFESHLCQDEEDHKSITNSSTNHITVLQTSPTNDYYFKSSRRNSLGDLKSVSSCNRCKPAIISKECKNSNIIMPLTDSHSVILSQPKNRGVISRLFPFSKKKQKDNKNSPSRFDTVEMLKRELVEANESRDDALREVSNMKSSFGDLKNKLDYLENYCEELKKALRQKEGRKEEGEGEDSNSMPVSEEVMVEGFLQITSEARLSVRQFCKILFNQVEETEDSTLKDNLNMLLQPYKLSLNSKYSKAILYHLEAIINQALYQDFENCIFQKNGSPKNLEPERDRREQFLSFISLRNLSWNEVLGKGTKYYCKEFSKFCDQKMNCIITGLSWTRPWPEQLLQAFFVSAKCVWLLHLLAFSFNPPLRIFRVDENRSFDYDYMEDVIMGRDRQHVNGSNRVKVMVMPGFYVRDQVLKCKVLCRYKPLP